MANIAKSSIKHIGRQVAAESGGHSIILDEPVSSKGTDAGANPVQYLLMALNGCLSITAESLAASRGVDLKKFDVTTTGQTQRFPDKSSKVAKIKVVFDVESDLGSGDQHQFIDEVLKRCTVHNSLDKDIEYQFEY